MLGMWNKQIANIAVKQYGNVSLHARVINTIPQFHAVIKNLMCETIIKVAHHNRSMHVHEE
jgi:hypothetical protein